MNRALLAANRAASAKAPSIILTSVKAAPVQSAAQIPTSETSIRAEAARVTLELAQSAATDRLPSHEALPISTSLAIRTETTIMVNPSLVQSTQDDFAIVEAGSRLTSLTSTSMAPQSERLSALAISTILGATEVHNAFYFYNSKLLFFFVYTTNICIV